MRTGVRQVLTDEMHNATQLFQGSPAFLGLRTPGPSQTGSPTEAPPCPAELSAWSRTASQPAHGRISLRGVGAESGDPASRDHRTRTVSFRAWGKSSPGRFTPQLALIGQERRATDNSRPSFFWS